MDRRFGVMALATLTTPVISAVKQMGPQTAGLLLSSSTSIAAYYTVTTRLASVATSLENNILSTVKR